LTEQGLRFVSAQRSDGLVQLSESGNVTLKSLLQQVLSVCHTLTLSENGDLVGPAIDQDVSVADDGFNHNDQPLMSKLAYFDMTYTN
jgi:hypothetical protein